ncbi:hypothetical protein L2E82_38365 [Cichorium intybus]|uniref:Uncharacterized protein n=1 Tax=Cichorium intybus TaxID=13427 RepID=A0ACB9AFD3_CICIN|nr:hypothetical protein L2E82_38365 [Cichorium intybus]
MSFATGDGREPEPSATTSASISTYYSTSTFAFTDNTSTSLQWSQPCRHFEFTEILSATENFDESLVLCRKRAVDKSLDEEQWGLVAWAQEHIKEGKLKHIVDFDIRGQISAKCLKEFVRIAEKCLLSNLKHRPTMSEVVFDLQSVLTLQEKTDSSLQATGKTIFGRMVDMLPFPSKGENSGISSSS